MSDLATHIKPLIDAAATALDTFEARRAEVAQHEESIVRFEKCRDASRQLADAENGTLRKLLKAISSPKEAVKHQAARNGHLEDVENFQALADEQRAVKKRSDIDLSDAASALLAARYAVTDAAIDYLKDSLFDSLPQEYFQLIHLIAEKASARRSEYFNADPSVRDPIEFACREASILIRSRIMADRNFALGWASLLPEPPHGLSSLLISPCQMNVLRAEVSRDESA